MPRTSERLMTPAAREAAHEAIEQTIGRAVPRIHASSNWLVCKHSSEPSLVRPKLAMESCPKPRRHLLWHRLRRNHLVIPNCGRHSRPKPPTASSALTEYFVSLKTALRRDKQPPSVDP